MLFRLSLVAIDTLPQITLPFGYVRNNYHDVTDNVDAVRRIFMMYAGVTSELHRRIN